MKATTCLNTIDYLTMSYYQKFILALDIQDGHFNVFKLPKLTKTKDFYIQE